MFLSFLRVPRDNRVHHIGSRSTSHADPRWRILNRFIIFSCSIERNSPPTNPRRVSRASYNVLSCLELHSERLPCNRPELIAFAPLPGPTRSHRRRPDQQLAAGRPGHADASGACSCTARPAALRYCRRSAAGTAAPAHGEVHASERGHERCTGRGVDFISLVVHFCLASLRACVM